MKYFSKRILFFFIILSVASFLYLCSSDDDPGDGTSTSSSTSSTSGGTTSTSSTSGGTTTKPAVTVENVPLPADYEAPKPIVSLEGFKIKNNGTGVATFKQVQVEFYLNTKKLTSMETILGDTGTYFYGYGWLGYGTTVQCAPGASISIDTISNVTAPGGGTLPAPVYVNRYGFPNGTYYLYAVIAATEKSEFNEEEADRSDNWGVSSSTLTISDTANVSDSLIFAAMDNTQQLDTFIVTYASIYDSSKGKYFSVATELGNNLTAGPNGGSCSDQGIAKDLPNGANAKVSTAIEFMGDGTETNPGYINKGNIMINFLINANTLLNDPVGLLKSEEKRSTEDDFYLNDKTTKNSVVKRWFPNNTVIHYRVQISPIPETRGTAGKYYCKLVKGSTVPSLSYSSTETNNTTATLAQNGCDLVCNATDKPFDSLKGTGAQLLEINKEYEATLSSIDDIHWYTYQTAATCP